MIELARAADPDGEYLLVEDGDYSSLGDARFDLILSAFAFDNIPDAVNRAHLLRALRKLLKPEGVIVLLCSAAEIYMHEWTSFTTAAFPENRAAKSGDAVRIVMKDVADARPVIDFIWFDEDYRQLFRDAGLELVGRHAPLGQRDEPFEWVSEISVSPWVIYVVSGSRSPVVKR